MMDEATYVNSIIGMPWVKGVTDCYWVVEDSFRVIDGIQLPQLPYREECKTSLAAKAALQTGDFKPCSVQDGAIFGIYDKDGAMSHVGRILAGMAVHSDGSITRQASCKAEPIRDMEKLYRRLGFTVKYYKYEVNNG